MALVDRRTRARVLSRLRALPGLRRYPATYVSTAVEARRLRRDLSTVRTFLLFIGHPRSGHSLVGALLDAHPSMLVAHELDVLKYAEAGFGREQLFALLIRHERARVARGHVSSTGYSYAVPGQAQGAYRRLEVIGDKKGGRSSMRLGERPELLDQLAATVGVPLSVVQVVRNPFDNIATMHRRAPRISLADHVDQYFRLAATTDAVRARLPDGQSYLLHLDDLTATPAAALASLCEFLGVKRRTHLPRGVRVDSLPDTQADPRRRTVDAGADRLGNCPAGRTSTAAALPCSRPHSPPDPRPGDPDHR